MPKGVVWRHEDVFFALGGGIDVVTGAKAVKPEDMVERALAGNPVTSMPIAPLMHGATQWGVMGGSFIGNKIVLVAKFDPVAGVAARRRRTHQHDDDHRRRDGPAACSRRSTTRAAPASTCRRGSR